MTKTTEIKQKIEELRVANQVKIEDEVNKTITDLKNNQIILKDDEKNNKINLNIVTNKRTIIAGASALAILTAASIFAIKKIKKVKKNKSLTNEKIIASQIDTNCEN